MDPDAQCEVHRVMDKQIDDLMRQAQSDQAVTGMANFAKLLVGFYRELEAGNIEPNDRLTITLELMHAHLEKALWPDGKPLIFHGGNE